MAVIFSANDNIHGAELWISNGTAAGTRLLKDVVPGLPSADPDTLVQLGDKVAFRKSYSELWLTDGSETGTGLVKSFGGAISGMREAGGRLFFDVGSGAKHDLWVSDGTVAGTLLLKAGAGLGDSYHTADLVQLGDQYVFTAADDTAGRELWVTDGTASGTHLLKDLYDVAGSVSPASSQPQNFMHFGGDIFFTARGYTNNRELFVTDGTANGTTQIIRDVYPFAIEAPSGYSVTTGGHLVFSGGAGAGPRTLWVSDGTAAGTQELVSGTFAGGYRTIGFGTENGALLDDKVVFSAYMTSSSTGEALGLGLWATDGTVAGTSMIKSLGLQTGATVSTFHEVSEFESVGQNLVFAAETAGNGMALWVTDGTAAGTQMLADVSPLGEGNGGKFEFVQLGGDKLLFRADDGLNGVELWSTDGTVQGTSIVKNINASGSSTPGKMFAAGGKVFFEADDGLHGRKLWATDGTESGTALLADISLFDNFGVVPFSSAYVNAPPVVALSKSAVAENAATGVAAGTLSAIDLDLTDTHTFALINNAGGRFALQGNNIVVADRMLLDFEQAKSHTITVRATDQTGKFVDKALVIAITDVASETVSGDARANRMLGGGGNDQLSAAAGNDTVLGGAGNDRIWGGDGADMLAGGPGSDLLTGGTGADRFFFDTKLSATNIDTITDFTRGQDHVVLDNAIFAKLGAAGGLRAAFFKLGAPADANDYIIYNKTTGALSYDADGNGAGASVKFAVLSNKPALSAVDFSVI